MKNKNNIRGIQYGYSEMFAQYMYDEPSRRNKALRAIEMFKDYSVTDLKLQNCLEVGSATGIMTYYLSDYFSEVVGIDIDKPALEYARSNYKKDNIEYYEMDALKMDFDDDHFDTIVCHHTYEHVADDFILMDEIYRVLRPGGLLCFGAPNRLMIKESHYNIYFLSWFPKRISSLILKFNGHGDYYYESMRTYWGIKKLLKRFSKTQDYTFECIVNPEKYYSLDVMKDQKFIKWLPKPLVKALVPFAPDLVLLAVK